MSPPNVERAGPSRPIWLSRLFPFLVWWPRVTRESARADLWAGMSGAIVVLPQGVAFATIAGMPPEYGLYAGMIPAIIAALFGSSWHLVSGPTTAASVVLFSALSQHAQPGSAEYVQLALTLTLMVGATQLLLGLARLGTLVNFISHSVLVGFTAGAGILILSKQLKNFFGLEFDSGGHLHNILLAFWQHAGDINPWVTVVGAVTLASGIVAKLINPRLPYMVIAMIAGGLIAALLTALLGDAGGIRTVGALQSSLPPLSMPDFSLDTIRKLAPTTLAVTLFALTEAVSIGRSLAQRSGQHINGNQEFIGQGLSNIAGSFFSGYVATGSFNRSAMNYYAGAKTPLAAVFAGSLLMIVVLLVAPLAEYLPNAAMAGILFLVAWRLVDVQQMKHILTSSRSESAVMAITFLGVLFLELDFAIFLGVLLSLVLYLNRASRPRIYSRVPNPHHPHRAFASNPDLPECPQFKMLRIDGPLFFGAVDHVRGALRDHAQRNPAQKHLAIFIQGVDLIDLTGAEFLAEETRKRRAEGGDLYLYGVNPDVQHTLQRGGYLKLIGADNLAENKYRLITNVFGRLDKEICARCERRIFRECAEVPKAGEKAAGQDPSATAQTQPAGADVGAGTGIGTGTGTGPDPGPPAGSGGEAGATPRA